MNAAPMQESGDGLPPKADRMFPLQAYERAARVWGQEHAEKILHVGVCPHWIGETDSFWYRVRTVDGFEFVVVDVHLGTRRRAFNHRHVAEALTGATGRKVDPAALPFATIDVKNVGVGFSAFGSGWLYQAGELLRREPMTTPPRHDELDLGSPDRRWTLCLRNFDLWIRDSRTGKEWALTTDGVESRSYARWPDSSVPIQLLDKSEVAHPPPVAVWSPDSRYLLTHVMDQREVEPTYLVETAPETGGRPRLHSFRYAMPGESVPAGEWLVFDMEQQRTVTVAADPFPNAYRSPISWGNVWWSQDSQVIYWLDQPRDLQTLWLKAIDPSSGAVITLIEEKGDTRVEPSSRMEQKPLIHVIANHREALWWSQRDGWGHLYLMDLATGKTIRQLTSGAFVVESIVFVDERERRAYLTVGGLVESDPYRRTLVAIGLDDATFIRLTDDQLDHVVVAPDHGRWFVDTSSTVETPPVTSVRDRRGNVRLEIERADVSALVTAGWSPPERVQTLAVDGETPLYGVLYKPFEFDPEASYPIIDHFYPGPQQCRAEPSFNHESFSYFQSSWPEPVAALGFAVLAIDGRGTPGRSKAFHDYSYGNLGDCALDDHVVSLQQLAEDRPWIDLGRVGAFGHSAGAFAAARALMKRPDVYHVGVAISGNHDNRINHALWAEAYDGPHAEPSPESDARLATTGLVDGLRGKLLLAHGDMDENVLLGATTRLVNALIAADKDFDMVVVPGFDHGAVGPRAFVVRRTWDYFVKHLMGRRAPTFRLPDTEVTPEAFAAQLVLRYSR